MMMMNKDIRSNLFYLFFYYDEFHVILLDRLLFTDVIITLHSPHVPTHPRFHFIFYFQ